MFLPIVIFAVLALALINRDAITKWWASQSASGSGAAGSAGASGSGTASGSKPAQPAATTAPPKLAKYAYVGCYTDKDNRDLPIHGGNMTIDECANQARSLKYGVFGIQYSDGSGYSGTGGECWYGKDKGYGMYGVSEGCTILPNGNGLGQGFSNAIYAWDDMPQ